MITMKHKCAWHGCNALINMDEKYCNKHKALKIEHDEEVKRKRESNKKYNKQRYNDDNKMFTSFYKSTAWIKTRELVKAKQFGLCQECLKHGWIVPGKYVDHIVPLRVDWNRRLDINNLQCLCWKCHRKKTEWEYQHYDQLKNKKKYN